MPFLHAPALGNTREHPRLGVPTFAGITLAEAPPSAAEFFQMTGVLKATLTGPEAVKLIVSEIAALTGAVNDAIAKAEAANTEAAALVKEAAELAAMPIMGTERATIEDFGVVVASSVGTAAIPEGTTSPVTYLKSVLPRAHGMDVKIIEGALASFDRALAAHETSLAKLQAARARLVELAFQAADGPDHEKVGRLKASLGFQRRLPQVIAELTAGREQVAAVLDRIDRSLTALKECAA